MAYEDIRKVVAVGRSLAVILPKGWARACNVKAGDPVLVRCNGRVTVTKARPK